MSHEEEDEEGASQWPKNVVVSSDALKRIPRIPARQRARNADGGESPDQTHRALTTLPAAQAAWSEK